MTLLQIIRNRNIFNTRMNSNRKILQKIRPLEEWKGKR